MVMVVALTALSSFVVPSLYEPAAVLKFVFIVVGGTLGAVWHFGGLHAALNKSLCAGIVWHPGHGADQPDRGGRYAGQLLA